MGFFDKLAGRPQEPRKANSRREQAQQMAHQKAEMRASRESMSPTGSHTGYQSHGTGHRPQGGYGFAGRPDQHSSRRTSTPSGRGGAQTPPQTSPRARSSSQAQYQYPQQHSSHQYQAHPHHPPPEQSIMDKWKNVMSFAPGRPKTGGGAPASPDRAGKGGGGSAPGSRSPSPAPQSYQSSGPPPPSSGQQQQQYAPPPPQGGGSGPTQVRDLQHKVGVMEAQLMEVDDLKRRLGMEQRSATEWKERWNFQNFKLNLMVDMLVLTLMEGEGGMVAAPRPGVGTPSSSTQVASFGSGLQRGGVGNGSVGAMTGSRRDAVEVIEEDVDDDY